MDLDNAIIVLDPGYKQLLCPAQVFECIWYLTYPQAVSKTVDRHFFFVQAQDTVLTDIIAVREQHRPWDICHWLGETFSFLPSNRLVRYENVSIDCQFI